MRQFCLLFPLAASILFAARLSAGQASYTLPASQSAQIVVPATPSPTERFAAEELRDYARRLTGMTLEIHQEGQNRPTVAYTFWVGKTTAGQPLAQTFDTRVTGPGPESFLLKGTKNQLLLVGGSDRGTLYSVYEFLEQQGCRWYFPGPLGEVVPGRGGLAVRLGEQRHSPDFVQREIGLSPMEDIDAEAMIDWAAKNRLNRIFGLRDVQVQKSYPGVPSDVWRKRGGHMQWQWICHNFKWMFDNERDFADHPDYFPLYKGRRIKIGSQGGGVPCLSNPGVIQRCADFANAWFDRHPEGMIVPLWPGDGAVKWCECPQCRKLGGENFMPGKRGSMTRRLVTFTNEVAKRVRPKHPDRYLLCPAYSTYVAPEPDLSLEPNVLVQYCLHGCYAHSPDTCSANANARQQIETWARQAKGRMGLWDYFLLGDHYSKAVTNPAWLPLTFRIADTMAYLHKLGFRYYFTQASAKYWKHNILPFYATAKLTWNSKLKGPDLITDFCGRFYGPAGPAMQELYTLVETSAQASDWHPVIYSDVAHPSPKVFTPSVIAQIETWLTRAEKACQHPMFAQRVALVRKSFGFVKANVSLQQLSGLDKKTPWSLQRHPDRYIVNSQGREVSDQQQHALITHAKDSGTYDETFRKMLFRSRKRSEALVFLESKHLKVGVIPGLGGRIVRLIDKQSGWNFLHEGGPELKVKSIGETYIDYGGYEEYLGQKFAGPGWEVPYTCRRLNLPYGPALVLTAEFPGLRLKRTIAISGDGGPEMAVWSELTNTSNETTTTLLRIHPIFTLGNSAGRHRVFLRQADGEIAQADLQSQNGNLAPKPAGLWAVANPATGGGIINIFDPKEAQAYLCKTGDNRFNMELFGRKRSLLPGQSLSVAHLYRILTQADSSLGNTLKSATQPQDLKSLLTEPARRLVKPISGKGTYQTGIVGQALRLDPHTPPQYLGSVIKGNAGTLEGWIRPNLDPQNMADQFLFTVGHNSPDWFIATIGKGKIYWLYKNGRAPYRGAGEFYATLKTDLSSWQAQEWHHLALVWADNGPKQSLMQVYLDGVLREATYTATIGNSFPKGSHFSLGKQRKGSFTGLLDDWCLSNTCKSASEIKADFQRGQAGQGLTPNSGTTLLLPCDGKLDGQAVAGDSLNRWQIKQVMNDLVNPAGQPNP
jgi:hypothetical protein